MSNQATEMFSAVASHLLIVKTNKQTKKNRKDAVRKRKKKRKPTSFNLSTYYLVSKTFTQKLKLNSSWVRVRLFKVLSCFSK